MTVQPTELRTERLLLRPYSFDDVEDVLAFANDEEWSRFLHPVPHPYGRKDAEEFVAKNVLMKWDEGAAFAITVDGRVVGGIGVTVDAANQIAELGYSIARSRWGKGIVVEAARAVIDWAFEAYDLAKIYARADEHNERSWRVMEKLGMVREGLLRSHSAARDGRSSEFIYGLLREEWGGS